MKPLPVGIERIFVEKLPTLQERQMYVEKIGGVYYTGDSHVHVIGKYVRAWILNEHKAETLELDRLLRENGIHPGATINGMARNVVKWGIPEGLVDYGITNVEKILPQDFHYQVACPGIYMNYKLFDLCAAYFQILRRLPSPVCRYHQGLKKIIFHPLNPDDSRHWTKALDIISTSKIARLSAIGSQLSGVGEWDKNHRGVLTRKGPSQNLGKIPSTIRCASALCIRILYEVQQMQHESFPSPYMNIDSCALPAHQSPEVWEQYHLDYRMKAQGDLTVEGVGLYEIGGHQSVGFGARARVRSASPSAVSCYNPSHMPEPIAIEFLNLLEEKK